MKRKNVIFGLTGFTTVILAAALFLNNSGHFVFYSRIGASEKTLRISNGPSELTNSYQDNVVQITPDLAILTYNKAKKLNDGVCTLNNGGSITKDLARGMDTFEATFSGGGLQLHVGVAEDDFTEHYNLTSGITVSGLTGNYFRIISLGVTNITSFTATYGCEEGTETSHTHTFSCNGNSDSNETIKTMTCSCGAIREYQSVNQETNVKRIGAAKLNMVENTLSLNENTNSKQRYYFYSDGAQAATLIIGMCPSSPVISQTVNATVAVTLNGTKISSSQSFSDLGSASWSNYYDYSFGTVNLIEGVNVIEISMLNASYNTNIGYIHFKNYTYGIYNTNEVKQEAEYMVLAGEADRNLHRLDWRPSGDGFVGDFQKPSAVVTFYVESDVAKKAYITINMGQRSDYYDYNIADYLSIKVNDVEQTYPGAYMRNVGSRSNWYDWREFELGNISLSAGTNTIVLQRKNGNNFNYLSNFDYVKLTTKGVIDIYGDSSYRYRSYRFEAEDCITDSTTKHLSYANTWIGSGKTGYNVEPAGTGNAPSGGGYAGNISSATTGNAFSFSFNSSEAESVAYLKFCVGERDKNLNYHSNFSVTTTSGSFTMSNDVILSAGYQYDKSSLNYFIWADYVMGYFPLVAGTNTVTITKSTNADFTNIDYFEIVSTKTITHKYKIEAELTKLTNTNATISAEGNSPSGGYAIGGIAVQQSGKMEFKIFSNEDTTATLGVNFGRHLAFNFGNSYDVYVNGTKKTFNVNITASSGYDWVDWTEFDLGTISLNAGWNYLSVNKPLTSTLGTNIDYFYLSGLTNNVYMAF